MLRRRDQTVRSLRVEHYSSAVNRQRNVKRWRNAEMALRWTAAGLLEAQKTFRRLKAYRQLPILDAAPREAVRKAGAKSVIEDIEVAA